MVRVMVRARGTVSGRIRRRSASILRRYAFGLRLATAQADAGPIDPIGVSYLINVMGNWAGSVI